MSGGVAKGRLFCQVTKQFARFSFPHYRSLSDFRFFFLISGSSNNNVVNNPACIGEYTFIQFIASAVCHRNPLTTGRYLGIKTTKRQFLQLCEVEVYSRGNGLKFASLLTNF